MRKLAINGGKPLFEKRIGYARQYIDDEDIQAVVEVLKSDYLTCGPVIEETERKFSNLTGAKYTVLVSNGTAALHAACYVAGISEGDEVITSPITFAASSNCILYCGGKPVFADINPKTYCIDPEDIESKITDRTKAVIAVDFTGQAADLKSIIQLCDKYNLILIEDAAHSLGTTYNNNDVGSIADLTTFSFHPVKTCTAGEGGAITTNKEVFYDKLKLFRTHGITRDIKLMDRESEGGWYYQQIALGYNYRLSDMQSALLSSQLDKLDAFAKRRKQLVQKYNAAFAQIPEIILQEETLGSDTVKHLYLIQLDLTKLNCTRREVYDALVAEGIGVNVHYIPVYFFPYYQALGYKMGSCPFAEKLYASTISLPLHYSMKDKELDMVVEAVSSIIAFYRK